MIGFLVAATYAALRLALNPALPETVFIETSRLLFGWYLLSGFVMVATGTLVWAGDFGSEGARMRHGVATPLAWALGLARVPLSSPTPLLALALRRLILGLGALWWMQGLRAVGAEFVRDEPTLIMGAVAIGIGLLLGLMRWPMRRLISAPQFHADPPSLHQDVP